MMALAQYFSKKPWPNLQQPPPPADVAARAQRANASVGCTGCHSGRLTGRGHPAAPRRPGAKLSAKDDDRFPQRRPRQQSRHDRTCMKLALTAGRTIRARIARRWLARGLLAAFLPRRTEGRTLRCHKLRSHAVIGREIERASFRPRP